MVHRHMDDRDNRDNQDNHNSDSQDMADMLEPGIVPVVLDMVEIAEHPVVARDTLALAQHTHCFAEREGYLIPPVVALHSPAGEAHMVNKPGETMAPQMDRQVRRWSHVHDA